jgi:glucose-6-phosphate dehydrogenase assembly protein OpcA
MTIDLTETDASKIASTALRAHRQAGSPTMGMVLTLIVVTDESNHYDALKSADAVSREHPSRVIGVIQRAARGASRVDAEVKIGAGNAGQSILLRMSGEVAQHAESVVLPLLVPDSPVVVWWPAKAPDDPAADPIGSLAQRRITDSANVPRSKATALQTQAANYASGNTDLAWTRLTPWRALLAAALDQFAGKVRSVEVEAERVNPSADLLAAWLKSRLKVDAKRTTSKGPGITSVRMGTVAGDIVIHRPDGRLAQFSIPGQPDRPVALKRRETAELLAEELRRLDPDDIYAQTIATLRRMEARKADAKTGAGKSNS